VYVNGLRQDVSDVVVAGNYVETNIILFFYDAMGGGEEVTAFWRENLEFPALIRLSFESCFSGTGGESMLVFRIREL
jgi:hypothetical protein